MVAEPIAPAPTPFHHSFELAVLQAQGLGRAENPMRPNRFRRCCPQHLGSAGGLCVPLANARNAGRPSACRRESQTVHWRPHLIFFTLSRKTAQKRAKLQGPPSRAEPRGRSGPRSTTAPRRRAERGPRTRRARSSSLPPICAPAPAATYGANSRAGATRARRARPPRGGRQRRSRPASNRVRTRAAVVVGPRAHPRHFRPRARRRAGARNARTESRPRGRGPRSGKQRLSFVPGIVEHALERLPEDGGDSECGFQRRRVFSLFDCIHSLASNPDFFG